MTTAARDALLILLARTLALMLARTGRSKAAETLHDAIHRVEREIADEKEPNRG